MSLFLNFMDVFEGLGMLERFALRALREFSFHPGEGDPFTRDRYHQDYHSLSEIHEIAAQ